MHADARTRVLRRIKLWIAIFIFGLVVSGVTAFPLVHEMRWAVHALHIPVITVAGEPALHTWMRRVHDALEVSARDNPFLAYGTDWLAFAHIVIAIAFVGPLFDPVRNKWVIAWGMIACAGIIPLAMIAGAARGIPIYWRMIDCSFGIFGVVPLWIVWREICKLERAAA
jgi:hypothetical protein